MINHKVNLGILNLMGDMKIHNLSTLVLKLKLQIVDMGKD